MSEVNDSNNANVSPTSVSAGRASCALDTATPGGKGDAGGASVAAGASVVAGAAGGSDASSCNVAAGASDAVDASCGVSDAVDASGSANAGSPQPAPKKTLFQVIKYLMVGGSSAVIELVLFQLLNAVFAISLAAANVTAVVVSTVFNFLVNRNVTFKSTSNPLRSLVLYLLLFALNTTFSTVVISFLAAQGVYPLVAKVCTMACIVLWNFVLYKKIIFK